MKNLTLPRGPHSRRPAFRPQAVRLSAALAAAFLATACADQPEQPFEAAVAGPLPLIAAQGASALRPVAGSPYGDFLAGVVAGHRQDLSAAADFWQRALEADPENRRLLRQTFELQAADGRHAEALRLARRVVEHFPNDHLARLVLAIDFVERGDLDAAEAALDEISDRGLGLRMKRLLGSWLDLGRGQVEQALQRIEPLGEEQGSQPSYMLEVALLNDVAGRAAEAEAAYRAMLEAVAQPTLWVTWLVGNFYERQGMREAAGDLYKRYLTLDSQSGVFDAAVERVAAGGQPAAVIPDMKAGIAEALFNLAGRRAQSKSETDILAYSHLALRLYPRFQIARVFLGGVLDGQGRVAEAIAIYRKVDPASPLSWLARLRVAEGLERLDKTEEAITELEGLAGERPDRSEPLFRVGNMLRFQERFAEAVKAYDAAFARFGPSTSPNWAMYYYRGIALERSGQWERAEQDLLAALDLEPDKAYVMNYLAYSWVEQGVNLDKAKTLLVRAVELESQDGYIIDSLGWVLYRLGEYEQAVDQLERAVELRSQDPVINDHLGDAYWRVGRHVEARFQWRRALSFEPEENLVSIIEAKIERGLETEPEKI